MTSMDETYETPEAKCPHCGHVINRASGPANKPPSEGDMSVCIRCAGVMAFNADGTMRLPTEEEENNRDVQAAVHLVQMAFLNAPPEGRA